MASFGIVSQNACLENGLVDGDLLVVREGAIWELKCAIMSAGVTPDEKFGGSF